MKTACECYGLTPSKETHAEWCRVASPAPASVAGVVSNSGCNYGSGRPAVAGCGVLGPHQHPTPDEQRASDREHERAGGWLCEDDGSGICSGCRVILEKCLACNGVGYHRDDCEEGDPE